MSLWGKVKDHKLIAQLLSSGEQQENSEELVREFIDENRRVVLDLRNQVLKLSVDDQIRALRGRRLFEPAGKELESPLQPTLGEFTLESADSDTIVSASMLALKAKQFDDGLYAAVEIALQEGTGISRGKAWLLQSLVQCLSRMHSDEGVQVGPMLFAAAKLGGGGC